MPSRLFQLFAVAGKELKLLRSQRIAIALIVLYPLLVMASLGMVFSQEKSLLDDGFVEKARVGLWLGAETESFDPETFAERLAGNKFVDVERVDSVAALERGLRSGKFAAAVRAEGMQGKSSKARVLVQYDNARLVAGETIAAQTRNAINLVGFEKSKELLSDIWTDLDKIEKQLTDESGKLRSFAGSLETTREKLSRIEQLFDDIDLSAVENDLTVFDSFYEDTDEKLTNSENDVNQMQALLQEYRQKVVDSQAGLEAHAGEVGAVQARLAQLRVLASEPLRSEFVAMETSLGGQVVAVSGAQTDLNAALAEIDATNAKADSALASIGETREKLVEARFAVGGMDAAAADLRETVEEGKPAVREATALESDLSKDIQETRRLLDDVVGNVGEFSAFQPGYLVEPIDLRVEKAFSVSSLATAVPIGIVLVLVLTCVLLTVLSFVLERDSGVPYRLKAAHLNKGVWLAGRALGQIAVAVFETIIILVVAALAFHVPLTFDVFSFSVALLLVSFAFVSLGLLLTNIVKTQSTGILLSLLLLVPMLFLSGIVFPLEFMPEFVAGASHGLPLTAAKELLVNVTVKGLGLAEMPLEVGVLLVPALAFFAATASNKQEY